MHITPTIAGDWGRPSKFADREEPRSQCQSIPLPRQVSPFSIVSPRSRPRIFVDLNINLNLYLKLSHDECVGENASNLVKNMTI